MTYFKIHIILVDLGRNNAVSITIRHGLDCPGIESRWGGGEIFRTRPDRPWGPPSLLYKGYQIFPGGKAAEAWHWQPTLSRAEVKERVEPYLYSPSGSSWPVLRWSLPLSLPLHLLLPLPGRFDFVRIRFELSWSETLRALIPGCILTCATVRRWVMARLTP